MSNQNFSWRTFLAVFLMVASLVTLISLPPAWLFFRGEEAAIHARQEAKISLASSFVSREFKAIISDLRFVSHSPALQNWVGEGGPTEAFHIKNLLLAFLREKRDYDNIRLLDAQGRELVRVENRGEGAIALEKEALQNKGARDYFKKTLSRQPGDIYISPMELNRERGQIERPFKPVIRFGTVLADRQGRKQGVVIFNFLAEKLIRNIAGALEGPSGQGMFLDREGNWFHAPHPADEWGASLGTGHSFGAKYPRAWRAMTQKDRGAPHEAGLVFTYRTVYPVEEAAMHIPKRFSAKWIEANFFAYRWKIVSVVDEAALLAPSYRAGWALYGSLLGVSALLSFFLARWRRVKQLADGELRRSQRNLNQAQRIAHLGSWEWEVASGNITWSNEAYRIYGYEPRAVNPTIQTVRDATHPEDRQKVDEAWELAELNHAPYEFECRIVTPDGTVRHVWQLGQLRRDSNGKPLTVVGTVLDVTERKVAEEQVKKLNRELEERVAQRTEELREANEHLITVQTQLGAAIEAISDGLVFFDAEDRLTLRNTKMLDLFPEIADLLVPGMKFEEIVRRGIARGQHPEAEGREEEFVNDLVAKHKNPPAASEQKLNSGKWVLVAEHRAADGGYVGMYRDITSQKQAQEALRESEERVRLLLESTAEAIYGIDLEGRCTFVNPACLKLLGYENQERCIGEKMHDLIHHTRRDGSSCPAETCEILQGLEHGRPAHSEDEIFWRADGESFEAEYWLYPIVKEENLIGAVVTFLDITDRKTAEAELRQAQKMEVVGQLTGGVAHDFNNILQIISAYSQVAQSKVDKESEVSGYLEKVIQASRRAASLTQQLLAFSRQQVRQPRHLEINALVANLVKMLERVIGENIELELNYGAELDPIHADPGMMEQMLLNLCINARDAMPKGGRLIIETSAFRADEAFAQIHGWAAPGNYLVVSVSDTGTGMTPEVRERIFEPFFTTKRIGEGTGLGLSTAYGTIRQHGGNIIVHSEQGVGSTFRIYLPTAVDYVAEEVERRIEESVPGGAETILVAEDENAVLDMVAEMLEDKGYTVLTATDGVEALNVFAERKNEIDLVMLDVVMPKMGGREVFEEIRKIKPALPVMFSTGYAANAIDATFLAENGLRLVNKPYSPNDLFHTVRQAIDGI